MDTKGSTFQTSTHLLQLQLGELKQRETEKKQLKSLALDNDIAKYIIREILQAFPSILN